MVLTTNPANYIGWPVPALFLFLLQVQRYKKYLNYANILAIIFGVFSIIPRIGIA